MAKYTVKDTSRSERNTVRVRTMSKADAQGVIKWWKAGSKDERAKQALTSAQFLKDNQQGRVRQASMLSRLYSNQPIFGFAGSQIARMNTNSQLPYDRPTMNVVQSCVDTLVSRLTQARPRPVFLTDAGDYKQRNLAKKLNHFMQGELYQTKAYKLAEEILRDAASWSGTGVVKVVETADKRVGIERKLNIDLLVDPNDALLGKPRQLYELMLIDRSVVREMFPEHKSRVELAEQAFVDSNADTGKSVSDMIILCEAWHLSSGPDAKDGYHLICCSEGSLLDEEWDKKDFPFVMLPYAPRITGLWAQSLSEQLMGTQMEINKLLVTITRSINLMGVPRVLIEAGSKIAKAHFNDQVGAIIPYQGIKPEVMNAMSNHPEVYAQLQRLVEYAYQQSGVSALNASAKKPEGLNSGAALREYDDLQSDRFATLSKRYDNFFIDLSYQIIDKAIDIAKRDGSYQTVYPNKDGTKEVDLPLAEMELDDPFVIQCFDSSALPRDPAGRVQQLVEWLQAGAIDMTEFRRMADLPDLEQMNKLNSASEERIFKYLDAIVEDGDYNPPDEFMDIAQAKKLSLQYYNLYVAADLEPEKAQMLIDFNTQAIALEQAMQPPAMPGAPAGQPMAQPEPLPTSPMIPQVPGV